MMSSSFSIPLMPFLVPGLSLLWSWSCSLRSRSLPSLPYSFGSWRPGSPLLPARLLPCPMSLVFRQLTCWLTLTTSSLSRACCPFLRWAWSFAVEAKSLVLRVHLLHCRLWFVLFLFCVCLGSWSHSDFHLSPSLCFLGTFLVAFWFLTSCHLRLVAVVNQGGSVSSSVLFLSSLVSFNRSLLVQLLSTFQLFQHFSSLSLVPSLLLVLIVPFFFSCGISSVVFRLASFHLH